MYKTIVIGGGPGGYVAAIRLAKLGFKVALIEKKELGGTCTNVGCIPTKALLTAAHLYNDILLKSKKFGIQVNTVSYDFNGIFKHMKKSVTLSRKGVEYLLKKNGIVLYRDKGIILDKKHVKLEKSGETINGENLILAQGSRPFIFPPFDSVEGLWTSNDVFNMKTLPDSILIIGGGVIGVEFSTFFSLLGKKVYLVELFEHILPNEDKDAAEIVKKSLTKNGTSVYEKSKVKSVEFSSGKFRSYIEKENGEEVAVETEKVILAVGRKANISDDIKELGIKISKKGIEVNRKMETSLSGIYAVGDITGEYMLAHVAMKEGIIAAENIAGKQNEMNYTAVPSIIFSNPEIASSGIKNDSEENLKSFIFPLSANARANTLGEREGFVKIIKDKNNDKIKGMTIVSPSATELITQGSIGIQSEMDVEKLSECIFPHPTLSEAIGETLEGLEDKSIHI